MCITLFPGVELSTSLSQHDAVSFLKRFCSVDVLGDSIYAKKLGNDKTEFAIDFRSNEVETIRKIKDRDGVSIDKVVYDFDEVKLDALFGHETTDTIDKVVYDSDEVNA